MLWPRPSASRWGQQKRVDVRTRLMDVELLVVKRLGELPYAAYLCAMCVIATEIREAYFAFLSENGRALSSKTRKQYNTSRPRLPEPLTVTRRVSVRGAIMIGGQRIQLGLPHAGKTAEVSVEADIYQITVEPGITITGARTTSRDIRRHKASNYG
jgi:hypothetical protein